jgi:hypothetical protein
MKAEEPDTDFEFYLARIYLGATNWNKSQFQG